MAAQPITIRLCGSLTLQVGNDHREHQLAGRQRQLLFAYLVLHRDRPVRRDELLDAVRAADGSVPGPSVLPPVLSRLRTVVEPARLDGRTTVTLTLPEGSWVDVEAARAALRRAQTGAAAGDWTPALALAREAEEMTAGGLLPGHEADWLDAQRDAVVDLRVEALELAARAAERLGGAVLPEAEQYARAAVAAAPFRESARGALIAVLRARGNTADALRAYDEVRVLLRDELGVAPGPELQALHTALLRPERAPPPPRRPAVALGSGRTVAGLEERDGELAELDGVLDRAGRGDGRLVLLEGPAGTGKTRLLAELRRRGPGRGFLVLGARSGPLEQAFPFGVVRQLLEPAVASGALTAADLAGAGAAAQVLSDAGTAPSDTDGFAVVRGLHGLVRTLAARTPLVLCVDDLHWCDRPSLRLLAYLARRLGDTTLVVAATLRTGEPGAELAEVGELVDDPTVLVLRPGPLGPGAVARLVSGRLHTEPDGAFATACHEVTGGNPLLVEQLLGALATERAVPDAEHVAVVRTIGVRAVSRSVLTRLARLSPDAIAVAHAIAVLGDRADLGVAAELAGVSEDVATAAAGVLTRSAVLRGDDEPGFVHPLVADAVYRDLPAPQRALAHRRAARLLADRSAGTDRVAAHLLQIGGRGDEWVVARLREAARTALVRGAPEGAVTYLERALAEPPAADLRPDVLLGLGRAEATTRGPAALDHLRAAANGLTAPGPRADAAFELARTMLYFGRADEGQALALRARDELGDADPDRRDALLALAVFAPAVGASRSVPADPPETPRLVGAAMLTAASSLDDATAGNAYGRTVQRARRALAVDALLEQDNPFWVGALAVLVLADRFDEATSVLQRALALAQQRGSLLMSMTVAGWMGFVHLRTGRLVEALPRLDQAIAGYTEWGTGAPAAASQPLAMLAEARTERDDLVGAAAALDTIELPAGAGIGTRMMLTARGELLLAQDRGPEALALAERVAALAPPFQNPNSVPWRTLLARSLAAVGRTTEALAVAEEDLRQARRWSAPSAVGRTLRVLGQLQGDGGRVALAEAVDVLAASPARLERAKALAALGSVTTGPERSRLRGDALAGAEQCGATRLARALRDPSDPARNRIL